MTCGFSQDALALYAAGDRVRATASVERHVAMCAECRQLLDDLREQGQMLRSLRRSVVDPAECLTVHRAVMSAIREQQDTTGWWLRLERILVLGVRQHAYAMAAILLVGIASASAIAQMRFNPLSTPVVHTVSSASAPTFEGADRESADTLTLPTDFREWMAVRRDLMTESAAGTTPDGDDPRSTPTVYVHPAAFREFQASGTFPDGTVFLWVSSQDVGELSVHPHGGSSVLLASVKDGRRFDGGWGFFDFTADDGEVLTKARALPDSRGCRTCHHGDAAAADPVRVLPRSART